MNTRYRLFLILGPLIGMVAGILVSVLYLGDGTADSTADTGADIRPALDTIADADAEPGQSQAPVYVCPMHAHIRGHEPGSCPICGMDLVLADTSQATDDADMPVVTIKPEVINNLGVRTTVVERGTITRPIDTMGMVSKITSSRSVDVTPDIPGRLQWIADKETGDIVEQGEVLYRIYSPERIQAQKEYLEAWQSGNHKLMPVIWEALRAVKFSDMDVKRLEETGEIEELYEVVAPQKGAVMRQIGVVGNRVKPTSRIFTLGGSFRIDLNAEVFEQHWGWVAFRQLADISIPSLPGGKFQGIVQTINKSVNFKTRSLTASLAFVTLNPSLREGMVADVTIHAEPREDVLFVPRDAVIRTADENRVVVVEGEGRFRPVVVETGIESGGVVEIRSGLEEGQQVVVSGQFLIDSESSLTASFRRMSH